MMKINSYKNAHDFVDMIKKSNCILSIESFRKVLYLMNEYNKAQEAVSSIEKELLSRENTIPYCISKNLDKDEVIFCLEKTNSRLNSLKSKLGE